jgi:hypothetical protein
LFPPFFLFYFQNWNLKLIVLVLLPKLKSKIDFCNFASYFTNPSPCSTLTLATQSFILFFRPIIVWLRSFMNNWNSFLNFFSKEGILR